MKDEEIWEQAYKSWDEISKEIGFKDRKTAYTMGFYAGLKKAPKSISEDDFRKMFKDLCKDAYSSKSAGDMWEPDKYRTWYEKIFK